MQLNRDVKPETIRNRKWNENLKCNETGSGSKTGNVMKIGS
jgi:hypothetical protein